MQEGGQSIQYGILCTLYPRTVCGLYALPNNVLLPELPRVDLGFEGN